MMVRIKILLFFAILGFTVWQGVKYALKVKAGEPIIRSSVPAASTNSAPVAPRIAPVASESPSPTLVRCENWGRAGGQIWGYADGIRFDGPPDGWKYGCPMYHESRGRPL